MPNYVGTSGNNTITGTSAGDSFNMSQGGVDSVSGLGSGDYFYFGSALTAADHIDGGTGNDTVELNGNYTDGQVFGHPPYFNQVTFTATTMVNVETLQLDAGSGNAYTLFFNAATVADGQGMVVDGSALASGNSMTVDGSAVGENSYLNFYAGSGAYTLTGGAGDDEFFLGSGFAASDKINGGSNYDEIVLTGNYTDGQTLGHHPYFNQLVFTATTMVNVEDIALNDGAGNGYTIFLNAATVPAGFQMQIDGSTLGSGNSMTIDGSAVAGELRFLGGAGGDTLTGGTGNDTFTGRLGADQLTGGGGHNTFAYEAVTDSTSSKYDVITGFNASKDAFDLWFTVKGIDAAVASGHLATSTFDADLASAIGASELAKHHAVLFTPDSGSLKGDTFLLVDANGQAGYQAGQDLVVELAGASHLANLNLSNFN